MAKLQKTQLKKKLIITSLWMIAQYHSIKLKFFLDIKRKFKTKIIDIKNIKEITKKLEKKYSRYKKYYKLKEKFLQNKNHVIMGVLNMTPDSFSDGGKFNSIKKAIKE